VTCKTGKKRFATRAIAERTLWAAGQRDKSYQKFVVEACRDCRGFHFRPRPVLQPPRDWKRSEHG
jgi:hypothetical protein